MIRVSTYRDLDGQLHAEAKTNAPYSPDVLRDLVNACLNLQGVDAIIEPEDVEL